MVLVDLTPTGMLPIECDLVFEFAVPEPVKEVQPVALPVVYEPPHAVRWFAWFVVFLAAAIAVFLCGGCSSTSDRSVHLVGEARILLKEPHPGGPNWEKRREIFLSDSKAFLEDVGPVVSGS